MTNHWRVIIIKQTFDFLIKNSERFSNEWVENHTNTEHIKINYIVETYLVILKLKRKCINLL